MDLTINLTGVQENSKYVLEFSLTRDGKVVIQNNDNSNNNDSNKVDDDRPSLEAIEEANKPELEAPTLEKPKSFRDFKVESSINPEDLEK